MTTKDRKKEELKNALSRKQMGDFMGKPSNRKKECVPCEIHDGSCAEYYPDGCHTHFDLKPASTIKMKGTGCEFCNTGKFGDGVSHRYHYFLAPGESKPMNNNNFKDKIGNIIFDSHIENRCECYCLDMAEKLTDLFHSEMLGVIGEDENFLSVETVLKDPKLQLIEMSRNRLKAQLRKKLEGLKR